MFKLDQFQSYVASSLHWAQQNASQVLPSNLVDKVKNKANEALTAYREGQQQKNIQVETYKRLAASVEGNFAGRVAEARVTNSLNHVLGNECRKIPIVLDEETCSDFELFLDQVILESLKNNKLDDVKFQLDYWFHDHPESHEAIELYIPTLAKILGHAVDTKNEKLFQMIFERYVHSAKETLEKAIKSYDKAIKSQQVTFQSSKSSKVEAEKALTAKQNQEENRVSKTAAITLSILALINPFLMAIARAMQETDNCSAKCCRIRMTDLEYGDGDSWAERVKNSKYDPQDVEQARCLMGLYPKVPSQEDADALKLNYGKMFISFDPTFEPGRTAGMMMRKAMDTAFKSLPQAPAAQPRPTTTFQPPLSLEQACGVIGVEEGLCTTMFHKNPIKLHDAAILGYRLHAWNLDPVIPEEKALLGKVSQASQRIQNLALRIEAE